MFFFMNILEIIAKKRDKKILNKDEIDFFVNEYTKGNIGDYQAAALIMAIYINGMTDEEITNLTLAMANSGDILDLSQISNNIVDKHSTGGVGDKITLILMPVIASLGIKVAKMSGRGLGFTGGTRDKLESIPGYNTSISVEEFIRNVKEHGISLMGQTLNLAPADKKIYALRDTISCTENIPLIASSIMSKKIAAGANKIVLEVTVGDGAFMKTKEDAEKLSKLMIEIGKLSGKETVCVLTNMNEPIGYSIGNTLEVIESIEALKGNMQEDVKEIVETLGAYMIKLAGKGEDIEKNKILIMQNIENGKAYKKFLEMVETQGGDVSYIEDVEKFKKAKFELDVIAKKSGYVKSMKVENLGRISCILGAGRIKKDDEIIHEVGITVNKKVGSFVEKGEIIAKIYTNNLDKSNNVIEQVRDCFEIVDEFIEKPKTILEVIK